MRKRIVIILLLVLPLLLGLADSVRVQAAEPNVVDKAGLLSESEERRLSDRAGQIADEYDLDVVIVTVNSMDGMNAEDFADFYYDTNGYGRGSLNCGAIIILSMEFRDWAVRMKERENDPFPIDEIRDNSDYFVPYFSDGDYNEGFQRYLDLLEEAYSIYTYGVQYSAWDIIWRLLAALGIGALIGGVVLLILRYRMNTARAQSGAGDYMVPGSYHLHTCQDFYLYSQTTRSARPKNNSSSGGGGSCGGRSGCSGNF